MNSMLTYLHDKLSYKDFAASLLSNVLVVVFVYLFEFLERSDFQANTIIRLIVERHIYVLKLK